MQRYYSAQPSCKVSKRSRFIILKNGRLIRVLFFFRPLRFGMETSSLLFMWCAVCAPFCAGFPGSVSSSKRRLCCFSPQRRRSSTALGIPESLRPGRRTQKDRPAAFLAVSDCPEHSVYRLLRAVIFVCRAMDRVLGMRSGPPLRNISVHSPVTRSFSLSQCDGR